MNFDFDLDYQGLVMSKTTNSSLAHQQSRSNVRNTKNNTIDKLATTHTTKLSIGALTHKTQ
jgi:hypothetical protein